MSNPNPNLWRIFVPWATKSFLFIHQSIYCLFTTTRVLFQKADKVTAAGQTVQDVDSQQSQTDSRRVIKVWNIYRNKASFKQVQSKRVTDSVPTSTRQVCVCLVRQTDGSAVWGRVLKKIWNTPKFSLSSFQSRAGSPQTVTNLIPSCIIRLFYSDNMNLCGGKAREGELTDDWAKDGVDERMMDGAACVCDSLDFFFQFNTLHFITGKIAVIHFSHWWSFYHYDVDLGLLAHTIKYWPDCCIYYFRSSSLAALRHRVECKDGAAQTGRVGRDHLKTNKRILKKSKMQREPMEGGQNEVDQEGIIDRSHQSRCFLSDLCLYAVLVVIGSALLVQSPSLSLSLTETSVVETFPKALGWMEGWLEKPGLLVLK